MPSIKLEIASDDPVTLRAFGTALNTIATERDGDRPAVSGSTDAIVPQVDPAPTADNATVPAPPAPAEPAESSPQHVPAPPAPAEPAESSPQHVPAPPAEDQFGDEDGEPDQNDTPTNPGGVTLDKNGLPWDKRIHAKTKAFNADGTWRTRRKPKDYTADDWKAYVDTVEGELRRALAGTPIPPAEDQGAQVPPPPAADNSDQDAAAAFGGGTQVPPPPAADNSDQDAAAAFGGGSRVDPPAPAATEQPAAQAPNPPAGEQPDVSFQDLMKLVTSNSDKVTIQDVTSICNEYGVQALPLLASTQPQMIPTVYRRIEELVNG